MSIARARYDIQRFVNNGGFQIEITLEPPYSGQAPIKLMVTHANHTTQTDEIGVKVLGKKASVTIVENDLITLGYNYKVRERVYLNDHILQMANASGVLEWFIVRDTIPNVGLGVITCLIAPYERIN